jgi:hypothetical protein
MVKTQVQLPEKDLDSLRKLAAEQGVSVSELVRRGVKQVLRSQHQPAPEERWQRARDLAGKFHSGKRDVGKKHDHYLVEAMK